MPNRTAKFVAVIFASSIVGIPLAALSQSAPRAADDCLAAPKNETPEGSHWYYRIDHATKRQCWYLRQEGEKLSQAAAPNSPRVAKPNGPQAETPPQRSISDARAEMPPQTSIPQPSPNTVLPPARSADATIGKSNTAAPGAQAQGSLVASRWLDPSGASASSVSSAVEPPAETVSVAENVQADSPAAAPPAVSAVPPAAADSSQGQPTSVRMLLAVLTGALALAGFTASAVIKIAGGRRRARIRVRRDKIWESAADERLALAVRPDADVLPRRSGFPRDLDRAEDPNERILEFLSQLAKQARS
jgi:hypothetical protein